MDSRFKIVDRDELLTWRLAQRQAGRTVVWTNGCFDLLHPGHIASLEAARAQGDCLAVGVNADASVRINKGPDRPILSEGNRASMLAALACVDRVLIFDNPTPVE